MPDTGFKSPTVSDNAVWTSPDNAFASDDVRATAATAGDRQRYKDFTLGVPGGSTINGIEVQVEAQGATGGELLRLNLSWDGGTTWTANKDNTFQVTTDEIKTYGGAADLWGHAWTDTELNNTNFKLRGITPNAGQTVLVDHIQVKVHYDNAAGGGTANMFLMF